MDLVLPYIFPKISDSKLEMVKYINLLSALKSRRQRESLLHHKPIDATVDLSTICQLRCPYCATGNGAMVRKAEFMNEKLYSNLLTNLGNEAFIVWYFSTGEPLLHKKFAHMISSTRHMEIFSTISTNLSMPLSDQDIDDLVRSGLGIICVSLDGASQETYSRYRVGGKFDLVVDNMRRLINRKRSLNVQFPLIEWRFLRFQHNQHEEQAARDLAQELGVDVLEFHPGSTPEFPAEGDVHPADIPLVGPPAMGEAFNQFRNKPRGALDKLLINQEISFGLPPANTNEEKCDWLYFSTMIYPNGAVGPCCVATNSTDDFCNVNDYVDFSAAWNNQNFEAARLKFARGLPSGTICDRCPNSAAQRYMFGQKIRAFLRAAPDWVLKILSDAPENFFLEIDKLLMPGEVGSLFSGALQHYLSEHGSKRFAAVASQLAALNTPDAKDFSKLLN